jgi:hypothetical protein
MKLRARTASVLFLSCLALSSATALARQEMPRLRPATSGARPILDEALRDSATIRALAAEIAASDLIVYVSLGRPGFDARGATQLVAATPHMRILRITIDAMTPPFERIPLLAHELQHAVEVARDPSVRDESGMRRLYARIGMGDARRQSFETIEAHAIERRARLESRSARASRRGGQ